MCLLLETIRIDNGQPQNLLFHTKRMDETRKHFWHCHDSINLDEIIENHINLAGFPIQSEKKKTLYKCRVIYDENVQSIECIPYTFPDIRSLKAVVDNNIDYSYKFSDRSQINELYERRVGCDDILIIKHGLITDTSYANVLFYNGKNWITPAHPLLKGTQRAYLLHKEMIQVADIRLEDLHQFDKVRLINAMIRFEDALDINILNIHV
jgi:4-amino-4-deoxychorismate lyase